MTTVSSASASRYLAALDEDDEGEVSPIASAVAPGEALRIHLAFIRPYLEATDTTDIAINRPGELWVDNDTGWHRHVLPELTYGRLRTLATVIATFNRQRINERTPILSAVLPDGERVQVILPPAVDPSTLSFTIRKPSTVLKTRAQYERERLTESVLDVAKGLSPLDEELVRLRELGRHWDFLELAVRERRNIVISGATGSGKTTLGKTLASFIPAHERVITIEDVREIELPNHLNTVSLLYSAAGSGTALIEAKDLLQACLRMKPSRILLAEIRSKVAYDYIVNVSSGHPGSLTTVHAGTCAEAFEMLALRMLESAEGRELSRSEILGLLRSKIDIVIQLSVVETVARDGTIAKARRITEIYHDPARKRGWNQ